MQSPFMFFFAFIVVLALIGLAAWLVRRFANSRLGANTSRGRMPRLAVIDAAAVDGRRRLVLVRRDNIEHLIMIGGPSDLVVESNIVRAMPARDQVPQRPPGAAEPPPPRIAPLPDAAWNDGAPVRSDMFDHPEPVMPQPPAPPPPQSSADQNLAEMAQRLEAALRRPAGGDVSPPVAPEPPPAARPPRNEAPPAAPAPQKSGFENLEDEMASLLGRPKNSS